MLAERTADAGWTHKKQLFPYVFDGRQLLLSRVSKGCESPSLIVEPHYVRKSCIFAIAPDHRLHSERRELSRRERKGEKEERTGENMST